MQKVRVSPRRRVEHTPHGSVSLTVSVRVGVVLGALVYLSESLVETLVPGSDNKWIY